MYCTQPSWLKKCKFPNTIFILWPRHIHCYNFINDTEDMLCKETASLNRMQHCPSMFSLPVALVKVIMITLVTDQLPKCLQTSWQSLTQLKFKTPSLKCYNVLFTLKMRIFNTTKCSYSYVKLFCTNSLSDQYSIQGIQLLVADTKQLNDQHIPKS